MQRSKNSSTVFFAKKLFSFYLLKTMFLFNKDLKKMTKEIQTWQILTNQGYKYL